MAIGKIRFNIFWYNFTGLYSIFFGRKKRFMNLGYVAEEFTKLDENDLEDANHINLYLKITDGVPAGMKSSIEIGCGRGGGCYVMSRYRGIENVWGMDRSVANINIAKKINSEKINFLNGDACEFQLDRKFDLIVCLESSHAYASKEKFLKNVHALMHENSLFCYADLVGAEKFSSLEKLLNDSGFSIVRSMNITAGVVNSIKTNSERMFPFSTRNPKLIPQKMHNTNGSIHSRLYKRMNEGDLFYQSFILKKI